MCRHGDHHDRYACTPPALLPLSPLVLSDPPAANGACAGLLPDPPLQIATDNNNNGLPDGEGSAAGSGGGGGGGGGGAAGAVVAVILILLILGVLYYKRDSLPCLAGKGGSSKGGGGGGLPSGWTSAIDPASGKTYYTNSATGETTWDMPGGGGGGGGGVAMGGVPAPPTSAPLPAGWKSAVDPASGKEYYVRPCPPNPQVRRPSAA